MNLISQNCLSGHLYTSCLKESYKNPFIWTVIDFNSMLYLVQNWDKINFKNYILVKDKNWNFSIIIDNNVKVQYVHYKFDINEPKPRKKGPGDICYNRIWEYIVSKYEERIDRMLQSNEPPIFCICNFISIYKDCIYTDEQLKILSNFRNVIIMTGAEKIHVGEAAKIFYNTKLSHFHK